MRVIDTKGFGAIRSPLLVRLCGIGLVASTALPAVAGSGSSNTTGSMNVARIDHTAKLLANGELLVAGGTNN
jgi:hypothetical protein